MASVLVHPESSLDAPHRARRSVCFVSWGAVAGRSQEIAHAVGGEAKCFFAPQSGHRPPVLVRYVLAGLGTVAYLLRRRPRVVVVTNPPIFAALVAYGCARLIGAALVMDSHPGGFGVQGDRVAARLQGLHRWMVRHCALVLVTGETWANQVEAWGGTAAIVHEAPGDWHCPIPARHDRLRVLFAARFAADEDPEAVVGAARQLPECDFILTGDVERCPAALRASAPDNVTFVGFLDSARYRAALANTDAVVCLTTEPTSVMRAAYEAVYALRPLIVSDWPVNRALFPFAHHTPNDADGLAGAIGSLADHYERTAATVETARQLQMKRWGAQQGVLVEAIDRLIA
jgi:glycosyltransferase involved in cell wall biosynthesis